MRDLVDPRTPARRVLHLLRHAPGRRSRVGLGLFLFCALSVNGHAATYYVDQSAGNDANSGTSPAAAWRNCPGMAAYGGSGSIGPGDTVYFDRADTWLVNGTQGLYLTGGVTYIGNSWGTGGKARIRANADLAAGVVRFRDHPTVATIFEGFEVDANSKVTIGIDINTSFWQLMNGATKRVKDCEVHHTWSRTSLGQFKYGIIISNHGGTGGYTENVEIINCIVHDTSRDALCLYPGAENKDCRIKNITVRGCQVYNTGQDPDYGAGAGILVKGYVDTAFIEYNFVRDTKGALMFINGNEGRHYGVGPTNIHIRHNIFTGRTAQGAILMYQDSTGQDPMDVKIYGNLVFDNTALGGLWVDSSLGNTIRLVVNNNTFYNAPVVLNNNSATFPVCDFKNNIFHYTGGTPLTDAQGKITSHANNIFYRGSGTLVSSGGTSYNSSTLSSYESSASSANPLFKNTANVPSGFSGTYGVDFAPNVDGFSLQQASPGIDRGAALTSLYSGSINSIPRPAGSAWDIGSYEFGAGQKPAAPANLRVLP